MKFELEDSQLLKLKNWQNKIKKKFGEYGNYTYSFTPTGIGNIINVYSDILGKTLNLTEVEKW